MCGIAAAPQIGSLNAKFPGSGVSEHFSEFCYVRLSETWQVVVECDGHEFHERRTAGIGAPRRSWTSSENVRPERSSGWNSRGRSGAA